MTLIGTGFPSAVDSADWRFLVDFRCGVVELVGGVRFLFSLLGEGAISSEEVDDWSLLSELLDAGFCRVLMSVLEVSAKISVCSLIPLDCSLCVGRPPVRFFVALAFRFVGLFWLACPIAFSF